MTSTTSAVLCTNCYTPLPPSHFNTQVLGPCPACHAKIQVAVFPAAFRSLAAAQSGERILIEGQSSCFFHDQKKAVIPCDVCGRFLCALCDLDFNGKHLCPQCLDSGRQKGSLHQLETQRVIYDNAALLLALTPMVIFVLAAFTMVTAPIAVVLGLMAFYKPNSILGFSRFKAGAGIVIALFQILVWVLMFTGVLESFFT
jgi:hypothetical protein